MKKIFKYIVDDFPYYESVFVDNTIWEYMTVKKAHSILRVPIKLDESLAQLNIKPTVEIRINSFKDNTISEMKAKIHVEKRVEKKAKIETIVKLKVLKSGTERRTKLKHEDYSKLRVIPHKLILEELGSHDQYTLQNRDELTLQDMDEEPIS